MMPRQSGVGRNRDPQYRHLRLPGGIAGVLTAIPRLRCLQDLFNLDLWLARTQQGRDQPERQAQKGVQKY